MDEQKLKLFWETQKGLVILELTGALRFTAAGRAHYQPLLSRHEISIATIRSFEAFCSAVGFISERALAENTREIKALIADRRTTKLERAMLAKMRGSTIPEAPDG